MTKTDYVAVNKVEAAGAGAIVWWKINGYTECEALNAAWHQRVDLDPELLMNRPTPGAALRRALASHARTNADGRQLISSLGEENAYAVVLETADGTDVHHQTLLKVRLRLGEVAEGDSLQLAMTIMDGCPKHIAGEIQSDFERNLATYSGTEISQWFSNVLLPRFKAVSLRDQGGMWFVPAPYLDLWYQAVEAVREVSAHQVYKIPALSTEADAVAGILDALAAEALDEATKMEAKIMDTTLGVRALKNQVSRLDEVTAKVVAYEAMLGTNLDTLRARLDGLNAQMAAAIFTAEAAKDAEVAA